MIKTKTIEPDTRTADQKAADERVASGDWSGFTVKTLLTKDGVRQLMAHHTRLLQQIERDPGSAMRNALNQPFRWQEKVFLLTRCEYVAGEAVVEVEPHDAEFVAEVKSRIESDPFHHLNYCQRFGFICLPEDYMKYEH